MSTSRRALLGFGGAGLVAGALGGAAVGTRLGPEPPAGHDATTPTPSEPESGPRTVDPHGPQQAGVVRPSTPAAQLNMIVLSSASLPDASALAGLLADLGEAIAALVAGVGLPATAGTPDDLSVLVGLGPRLVALTNVAVPVALPAFVGSDAMAPGLRGGDLVLQVSAAHPETVLAVSDDLTATLGEAGFTVDWSQQGYRPRGTGLVVTNPLGFRDGVQQPEFVGDLPEHVFLTDGPAAGGTVGVVRRFVLDTSAFARLDVPERESVIGRREDTGAPLSGGGPDDEVNLLAKSPTGEYLIPAGSHSREAHPSLTGSTLMLRRSYAFRTSRDGGSDLTGLLFVCFADDVEVFARTQARMDREDRLMEFVTPTAEVAFLVLPGFSPQSPLGSPLFA